ncbi:MAG: ribonuclease P protein component [Bacilli bacterium]|jgi:ribonuclease P protein component
MKKQYRLKKSEDFKKVLDQRHCAGKNESANVYYASNNLKHARIGISVSTKIGNAIVRARVRRQVRAQINLTDVLGQPFDIVIIAQKGYLKKSFQENTASLETLFSRLGQTPKGEKA